MPTVYRRTKLEPSLVGTSQVVTIPTAPATLLVSLSGYMGWRLTNVGPSLLSYGDSSVSAGTGDLQYYSVAKTWYPIADTMSTYVISDSVAGTLQINYYL